MTGWVDDTCSYGQGDYIVHSGVELYPNINDSSKNDTLTVLTKLSLTRLKTVRERSHKVTKVRRLEDIKMNDELDIATSLPDPIAIPTSATVRAWKSPSVVIRFIRLIELTGASLIPSPIIATMHLSLIFFILKVLCNLDSFRFTPTRCNHCIFCACNVC